MKPKPKQSHVAALGLTAALLGGGCGGPRFAPTAPDAVTQQMSPDEQAKAEVLRSFYEEVRAGILRHSPEKLAAILENMAYGLNPVRDDNTISGESTLFISGLGAPEPNNSKVLFKMNVNPEESLPINLTPLLRGLKSLAEAGISPLLETEVRNVFKQAIYSALLDEKYKGLKLEGFDMQGALHNPLFNNLIEEALSTNTALLVRNYIREVFVAEITNPLKKSSSFSTPNIGR